MLAVTLSGPLQDVEDTSPNRCAASYKVLVVSSQFEGKSLLQRHRYYTLESLSHHAQTFAIISVQKMSQVGAGSTKVRTGLKMLICKDRNLTDNQTCRCCRTR